MNKEIRQLEDYLIQTLNNSPVPIEAKRYVLLNVLHLVQKEADQAILDELTQKTQTIVEEGEVDHAESTR